MAPRSDEPAWSSRDRAPPITPTSRASTDRGGWKGNGPGSGAGPGSGDGWRPRPSFWLVLLVMFVVNWFVSSLLLAPRLGRRCRTRFPGAGRRREGGRFRTYRPSFADDALFQLLRTRASKSAPSRHRGRRSGPPGDLRRCTAIRRATRWAGSPGRWVGAPPRSWSSSMRSVCAANAPYPVQSEPTYSLSANINPASRRPSRHAERPGTTGVSVLRQR